jgi:hypothetical protein
VFDAADFNRLFCKGRAFVKTSRDWKASAKAANDTSFLQKHWRELLAANTCETEAAVAALYSVALPAAT